MEEKHTYDGHGTNDDPFIVEFHKGDPSNPMNWSDSQKWFITSIVTLSVFAVTLASAAYSESSDQIIGEFHVSAEVFIVGVSDFVLGFAVGPVVWGPLLYGRKPLWLISHIGIAAFIGGSAGSNNIATLLVLRFLSGTFGGSPLVNSGGTIADLFPPLQRGLAMTLYCTAPFLGPVLGPTMGGFISENVGWRWVQGVCCILIGVIGILGVLFVPETYGPVLLSSKAKALSKETGLVYISILERDHGKKTPSEVFKRALFRPWVFLFREPIVLFASLYIAILYGILYMFLGIMPLVFSEARGWGEGLAGLAFMGITVGILLGLVHAVLDNDQRYIGLVLENRATAEDRLPPALVGAPALPIGIFVLAWTTYPSIHWSVPIILSAPFGFGIVLVILPLVNYLIDSYTIYAASVLTAAAIFRSLVGAAFPLFTNQMYNNLGVHWATSIPAFLTLACMPFPFIMYRYGAVLRMKCKYSAEAAETLRQMQLRSLSTAAEVSTNVSLKNPQDKNRECEEIDFRKCGY